MTLASFLPRRRRYRIEWGFLLAVLLAFGSYIAYSQYQERIRIETQEREHLTSQVAVIEKNLMPQLHSANKALESIRSDLPRWLAEKDGLQQAQRRLHVFSETLPGIRTLLVVDAHGKIIATTNEKVINASVSHLVVVEVFEYFEI